MASESPSSSHHSGSESEEFIEENPPDASHGYGFEPTLTSEELRQREERRKIKRCLQESRLNSTTGWCLCERCSVIGLRRPKEAYCCKDEPSDAAVAEKVHAKLGDHLCISMNPEFATFCLDEQHLQIIELVAAEKSRRMDRVNFENTKTYRHAAYLAYTYWVYGKLGWRNRFVIPACVVRKIRERFPEESGLYHGYKSASDEENNSDAEGDWLDI